MRNILFSTIIASITVIAPQVHAETAEQEEAREQWFREETARLDRFDEEQARERVRSRETRALTEEIRRLRADAERRARLAEDQRFIDELDRQTEIRRARNEARRSRDIHLFDDRGNSYYGTVEGY